MRTYAEYLNSLTVKALHSIARNFVTAEATLLKGYSKLRKTDLIIMLDNAVAALVPVILDTEVEADHAEIVDGRHLELINNGMHYIRKEAAIIDSPAVAQLHRSLVAPVKATQMPAAPRKVAQVPVTMVEVEDDTTEDLIEAYRYIRKARHNARGALHVSLTNKLANLHRVLKSRKVYMREV